MAESDPSPRPKPKKRILFTSFGVFLLFVLVFVIFFFFNFKTVQVQGPSMEPTLLPGRRVLVSSAYWLVGEITRKDIVVLKTPKGDTIIKRVYGLAGDKIDVNNYPESYSLLEGEYVVPDGTYFVLGDNTEVSEDSRAFGPIEVGKVIGKVLIWNF